MVRSCRCEIRNENPTYALKAFIYIFRNGPTSQCIMNTALDDGVSIHEVYSEPSTVASTANVKVDNDTVAFHRNSAFFNLKNQLNITFLFTVESTV